MRKIGYVALSLYLLLISLAGLIAELLIPNILMTALALIAAIGIFYDQLFPGKPC